MIKYIGSKRVLIPAIVELVRALEASGTVIDLFSGTARVGHALKASGYRVLSNDHNAYAATLARCYVQADVGRVTEAAERLLPELSRLPGRPGYFTETFCERSRFFQPKNGERIDRIREEIARKGLEPELEAVLLVSLMEAADRVDSTTGVQMAFLKQWAPRSHNDLELRMPAVLPVAPSGKGGTYQLDAGELVDRVEGDIAYLDPPYNQHKYLGNYHIWETLVRWDQPEVYGVACKRVDCKTRRSAFNSRPGFVKAIEAIIRCIRARHLVVSFSNEGFISRTQMIDLLRQRGEVYVLEREYRRYVGAQIGIYNPSGNKVGSISHLANKEYLFVVSPRGAELRFQGEALPRAEQWMTSEVP